MAVIAIDAGATVCKAAVFEGDRILGYACRHYGYQCPEDGRAEQDASEVWRAVDLIVREALSISRAHAAIQAICVSVQGDAIIPIDSAGAPLAASILGMDTRSHGEALELANHFGSGPLYSGTGMPSNPLSAITKIFWLERNRRDIAKQVWKYVHYQEFLLMKIAGIPALDFSMASRTMAFDPVRKDWVAPVLDYVGIGPGHLGNVTPSGVPVGIIRAAIADAWGIGRKTFLISGGHNQCMAAIGAGVIEPDAACYSMGTAEVISACLTSPRMSPAMLEANFPCYCHVIQDRYFTIALNQSGGLSIEWLHNSVFEIERDDRPSIDRLLNGIRVWPSSVLFLPHLVGSGTPACDYRSRGAFVGLSIKTGKADLLQAVIDAQAFEARLNLESLEDLDIPVTDLRAVDWGARMWRTLEIKATVLNRPIHTLRTPDAALLGSAMLAQTAIGQFASIEAACAECVQINSTIEPVSRAHEAYEQAFERYRPLYRTLKTFYHHWHVKEPIALIA